MDNVQQQREDKLSAVHREEEEKAAERRAQESGFNYINLSAVPIARDSLGFIPEKDARRTQTVVIQKKGQTLKIGAADPTNQETKQLLEQLQAQGFETEVFIISVSALKRAWGEFKFLPSQTKGGTTTGEISLEDIGNFQKELVTFDSLKDKINKIDRGNTGLLLEIFLGGALNLEASDIHIEPEKDKVRIRFRLDGVLQLAGVITNNIYQLLLSRIKLLSGLQINIQDMPQGGRFTIKEKGGKGEEREIEIEVRTSVLPGAWGEYIVLRILNPNAIRLEVKDLGIRDYLWQLLEKELKKNSGIILVTGPTGSGKTTTLYAFLKHLNQPGIKIVTLEDPIEYHLEGVNQSQIEPEKKYTFAQGLRSVLRQDPNVILVGEIRDEETADVALHAALTGHLVFSTLHTNNAVGAVPRFLDLNAKPKILSSALNAAIGQRLVRKLCPNCKKETAPNAVDAEKIKKELAGATMFDWPKEVKIYSPTGCEACGGTGYKGRVGIYEVLLVDEAMKKTIDANPSDQEVLEQAKRNGFITMYQDGLIRVLAGETTLEEVERVTSVA
ncbi:MAG: type II/IV secretion system protein [Parcubacteria group bacterium]|nr:type II/IV secretion system protein [Parcubacteria group bacterium]